MSFDLIPSEVFLEQVKNLSSKSKKQIKKKLELLKYNPSRFKRIHSRKFSKVFRVRLNMEGQELRLIYVVIGSKIVLVCLLDRKRDYKDLERYLSRIQSE